MAIYIAMRVTDGLVKIGTSKKPKPSFKLVSTLETFLRDQGK